jgi:hypothetical protein
MQCPGENRTYKDITDPFARDQNIFLQSGPCGKYEKSQGDI